MRPTNLNAFKLPSHRIERTVDALIDWIERHWSALAMVAIFTIWGYAMDDGYHEQVAAANAQRDEVAAWAASQKVRVSIEGDGPTVRALAFQMSVLAK